jgi:hypothetical protein
MTLFQTETPTFQERSEDTKDDQGDDGSATVSIDVASPTDKHKRHKYSRAKAHPHKFVLIPGDPSAFCVYCRQRTHEFWEEKWIKGS